MLTFLAWIVFILALAWNITLVLGIFICWYESDPMDWKWKDTLILLMGFAVFFGAGAYLFGVW